MIGERIPILLEEVSRYRDSIHVGQMIPVKVEIEEKFRVSKVIRKCKVIAKYEHFFMVQASAHQRECFRYIDMIVERRGSN